MDLLMKKQKMLKDLLAIKCDKESVLKNLIEEKETLEKTYNEMNYLIKTSNEFKTCVNASKDLEMTKKEKFLKLFTVFFIIIIIILINILTKRFFDIINFPLNIKFVILVTLVESFGIFDLMIIKAHYEHKIELNANKEMRKYILDNEKELTLQKEKKLILQNKKLVIDKIDITSNDIKTLNEKINELLFELLKEEKIKDLLIKNIINNNEKFDKEITLIIDDYDNKMSRIRSN